MRKCILLVLVFFTSLTAFTQDFSNKGKDFWLCFPQHVPSGANLATLSIFITSDRASTGTITMPNGAFSATFNIAAFGLQEIIIPWNASIHIANTESSNETITQILNKSIRVKVDPGQPAVVAYAQQWAGARSAATLLLPVNVLGRKYFAVSFNQAGSNGGGFNARSQFQIIATKPNTVVEITPVKNGVKQATYTVTLPLAGDMIQYQSADAAAATQDLTGTYIESVASGTSGCLPIAVYSGSSNVTFGTNWPCTGGSYDPLWQQLYPSTTWGKNFGFIPFADYLTRGNPFRVMASEDNTNVYFDGTLVATLNMGQIYPAAFTAQPQVIFFPTNITADKPICVTQYAQADVCTGQPPPANTRVGDPDMVVLNPIEQNISDITIFSSGRQNISRQYLNILIKSIAVPSFRMSRNGGALAPPAGAWQNIAGLPGYSYLRELLPTPPPGLSDSYRLVADSGFNAIAYGWGNVESYAYSAGTNVRDLYQQIGVQTTYGIETTPSVCTNSPFRFKVSLPYCADSIRWDLSALPGPPNPAIDTIRYNTCVPTYPLPGGPDSTTVVNGRTLYWYSLPNLYTFSTIGTYPVSMITYSPNASGCGSEQLIDFDLQITDPPTASFNAVAPGCYLDSVRVTETTPQVPKTTYRQWWEFYDPATIPPTTTVYSGNGVRSASHLFTTPGVKQIRHASITTPGCLSDTIVQMITLPDIPSATISGTTAVCLNAAMPFITFTGTGGTAEYIFSYNINGGATLTTPPSVGGIATVAVPTNVAGPFRYNLVSVQNQNPPATLCTRSYSNVFVDVAINPLPNAAIAGGTTVCLNGASPAVSFTGSGGTAPYTFAYSINGTPQTPVVSNAAGIYIINAPTNVVGAFTYTITLVTDASSTLCSSVTNVATTITVNDLPDAAISGAITLCLNAAQPTVTFTGSGGTAPYTFNYTINGAAQPPLVSNAAGIGTINAPTNVAGTFTYALVSVQEGSPITCLRSGLTGTTVITINPLPAAAIAGATTVCLNGTPPPVTFTGSGGTAPYTFAYSINGTPQTPVVSNAAGIYIINAPTNVAGAFTYTITLVTDASSTLCSSTPNVSTTITINDLPDAAISGATAVCLNAAQPPVTFTGSGGTAPYTFNYTINGVAQPPLVSNAAGIGTINAPTNVAGTFTYALVSVQEGSPIACLRSGLTGTTIITVNPLPTASISGTTEVCLNDPSPFITFTGTGSTAPYTFSYTINAVAQPPIVSNAAGIATIAVPTTIANTFTYILTSVQDASSTLCTQVITGQQAIVIVHPLPTANFNYTAPSCETRTINFTDASVPNVGTLTGWAWNFGDPASGGNNTSTSQNPSHTFATAGSYIVELIVTSSKGCSNLSFTRTVVINDRPLAGFIIPEVCLSDTYAQFLDTSRIAFGTVTGWEWDFGDPFATPPGNPNTSTQQNPTHSYTAVGTYNVRLIATSALGCKDTITQVLQVNGSFPVAIFSVNNPTTLCANDSVAVVEASTVFPGTITKVEIWFDNAVSGPPGPPDILDDLPFTGKVYRHLYPNFQTPLTRTFQIRYRAYSGGVCLDDSLRNITVNAAPLVQFNNMPDTCLLAVPFQITQASEIGAVPGTGVFSGPGVSPTGIFSPLVAGIGTHTILYTFTSTAAGCVDTMSNTITVLDTAHAAFTYVTPSCEQTATSFTDISTAPAVVTLNNTVWNFGDGTPIENHAPGSTFGHVFAAPGTYTVTMYNVSAYGCNSTVTTHSVTVDPNHSISLTSANNIQTRCINRPIADITYTLAGGATDVTIANLPPGVTYSVTGTTLTITGAPTSTVGSPYNFTIQTIGNTCLVATATGRITVEPDHTIAYSSGDTTQSVCVNTAIDPIIYDLGGGATGVTIANLPPGVTFAVVGNILTISGTPTTTLGGPVFGYTITTAGNTCIRASAVGEIKVNPYPVPNFTVDKPSYCIPNAVVGFIQGSTMPDGSSMTYSWDFGDGFFSTGASPTHWYATEGPFNVKLSVRSTVLLNGNITGCAHDTTIALTTIHPQPKADFVFNKPSICIGDNVTITDNTNGKDGTVNQWHWDMGDGTIRTVNPVTYTYFDTITYNITMYSINSHGCNSDTITKSFTVYPYPHVNAGPDRFVLEGGSILLETITFANDPQYAWTPNLYLTDSRIARPRVVNPKTDMTYRLTVTARGGCTLSDDVFVKLLKFPVIPNTFTPNNDGINDKWRIDYLNTYPNNRVQIFTRAGNLVFESRGYDTPWDGTLKGKPLPFDTYYYIIEPGNGRDPITGYVTIIK